MVSKRIVVFLLIIIFILVFFDTAIPSFAASASLHIDAPGTVAAGKIFYFTVSESADTEDAIGIVASNASKLAPYFKFSERDKGTHKFKIFMYKCGINFIKVYDLNNPDIYDICKINVTPGDLSSIDVMPLNVTVVSGRSVKFSFSFKDVFGNTMSMPEDTSIYVESTEQSAGGVYTGNGQFVFNGEGKCKIVVKSGETVGVANVYVVKNKKDFIYADLHISNGGPRENASYNIILKNGSKALKKGSIARVYFPYEIIFPCPCHKKIVGKDILFNGIPLSAPPLITVDGYNHIVQFTIPQTIKPFSKFSIIFQKSAGIKNPLLQATQLSVVFSEYRGIFFTNPVEIYNLIDTPSVYAFPSYTGRKSDFVFVFHTLDGFHLNGGDKIGIVFPFGSVLPKNPEASYISINNCKLPHTYNVSKWNSRTYIINLPFNIYSGQTIVIKVSKKIGIQLPCYEGFYDGGIIYNFDIKTVKSKPMYIKYKPLFDVSAHLPSTGNRTGIYSFSPEVSLSLASTYGYIANKIFYSLDNGHFVEYDAPFSIGEGKHIITYYAENTLGLHSAVKSIAVTVDLTPPKIIYEKSIKITENVSKVIFLSNEPLSKVTVNGWYTVCDFNGEFYVFMKSDVSSAFIDAEDLAGNETKGLINFNKSGN